MKKLLLLLSLISFQAFATDRGVPCNSNSCSVKIVAKDSGGVDTTAATFNSTGMVSTGSVSGGTLSATTTVTAGTDVLLSSGGVKWSGSIRLRAASAGAGTACDTSCSGLGDACIYAIAGAATISTCATTSGTKRCLCISTN